MIKVLSKELQYHSTPTKNVVHFSVRIKTDILGWSTNHYGSIWRVKVNGAYHWEQVGGVKITDADTLNEIQRLYNEYLKRNGGVE